MKVRECIELLSQMDPDYPVFFDCPRCGKANTLSEVAKIVLIRTRVDVPDDGGMKSE